MTDDRDDAEFLDGDVLGEEVGDDDMPGVGYPPEYPLGVDDPSRVVDDDVATRELRRAVGPPEEEQFTLVSEDSSEGLMDTEAQEVAAAAEAGPGDAAPEEQALHIIEPDAE